MSVKFASWIGKNLFIRSYCFAYLFLLPNSIIIKWSANSEPDVGGYNIYIGTSPGSYGSVTNVGLVTSYTFNNLESGRYYYFTVTAYDTSFNESLFSKEVSTYVGGVDGQGPDLNSTFFQKCYNFPNPFNPQKEITQIRYFLHKPELVTIKIYNDHGEYIRTVIENKHKSAGEHLEDIWDGKNDAGQLIQNGIYFCTIKTPSRKKIIKIAIRT